jgi:hypothetical protein
VLTAFNAGYDLVQLRLVFSPLYKNGPPTNADGDPLVYVEYFQRCGKDQALNMYKYKRALDSKQRRISGILPLKVITKTVQLIPWFGEYSWAPRELNSANVLDDWSEFLLNSFSDDYIYQTVY